MNNLNISPEARNDILKIKRYISNELDNPVAAENTVHKIIQTIRSLTEFANIGKPLSAVLELDTDYRYLISGKYLIFYYSDKQEVYIVRVLYARRDYIKTLFGNIGEDKK